MTRVALRGLLGRKLRAALTAVAVVLGVAMISGTYVLTDTIKSAFGSVFTQAFSHADAVITGKSAIGGDNGGNGNGTPSLPGSLLARVRALPQVARAAGGIADTAQLVGSDGKVISRGGAPGLAFSYSPAEQAFTPLHLASGNWPGPGQVDIDAATASKQHYVLGQQVGVVARGPGAALPGRRHGQVRGRVVAGRGDDDDLSRSPPPRRCSASRASTTKST